MHRDQARQEYAVPKSAHGQRLTNERVLCFDMQTRPVLGNSDFVLPCSELVQLLSLVIEVKQVCAMARKRPMNQLN